MRGGGDVIFLATRPPPAAPLPRGSGPEDAAAARRQARAAETTEARRDGGVGTHAVARALQACLPAASDRHVTASAARSSLPAASSRYEPGGDDAPGTWADALSVMADTLRDLGSLRTPHLGSSRPLDPASDAVRVVHPLSEHGARRAVFVGVNYAPFVSGGEKHRRRASSSVRLRHREDDCRWMLETLAPRGFDDPDGARVLVDDGHEDGQPTWANITRAMAWLTRRAQPGDSLAFHFSGRTDLRREDDASGREGEKNATKKSTRRTDRDDAVGPSAVSNDREFRTDAALLPCDWEEAGAITREELYARLVKPLPRGAKLLVVIDSPDANAADVVDTPYAFGADSQTKYSDATQRDFDRRPSVSLGKELRRPVSLRDALDASSAVADALFTDARGANVSKKKESVSERKRKNGKREATSPETGCCVVS